jgi:hypothetical protein
MFYALGSSQSTGGTGGGVLVSDNIGLKRDLTLRPPKTPEKGGKVVPVLRRADVRP